MTINNTGDPLQANVFREGVADITTFETLVDENGNEYQSEIMPEVIEVVPEVIETV